MPSNLKKTCILIIALVCVLTACGAATQTSPLSDVTVSSGLVASSDDISREAVENTEPAGMQQPPPAPSDERVILKDASLTITVIQPESKINEIVAMAEAMGGWVVASNAYTSTTSDGKDVTYGSITVRVPADRLNDAINQIKSGVEKVESESVNGQDVTQEYVDLSSQLTNLQATEKQLQTIMARANKVEDVLAVQRELTTVQGQIETIQGRLKYFDEAAAFSSIQVQVQPQLPGPVEAQSAGWSPSQTAENALSALVGVVQFLVDTGITLIILGLPLVLVLGIPAWFIWKRRSRAKLVDQAVHT